MISAVIDKIQSTAGNSNINVKLACPRLNTNDVPMTDFTKLSKDFIAYVQDDPMYTYNIPVADAYNLILNQCIEHNISHVIIIESDMIVPRNAIDKLLTRCIIEGHPFVCGIYPFKDFSDTCMAVINREDGTTLRVPNAYERRGLMPVNLLPMGCCIIDLNIVKKLPKPWFATTYVNRKEDGHSEQVSQDAYFSKLMIANGHQPMLDTDIQCVHVCRDSFRCFGTPYYTRNYRLRQDNICELAFRNDMNITEQVQIIFDKITLSNKPGMICLYGRRKGSDELVMAEILASELTKLPVC